MIRDSAQEILELFAEAQDRARYLTARHELTLVVRERPIRPAKYAPRQAPPLPPREPPPSAVEAVAASEALREAAERFAITELSKGPNEAMGAKASAAGVVAPEMPTHEKTGNVHDAPPGFEPGGASLKVMPWAR